MMCYKNAINVERSERSIKVYSIKAYTNYENWNDFVELLLYMSWVLCLW